MPDKKQLLLDAAKNVFAKKGFHGASIKDIALKAGVAQGTPYLYFKSKEDLLTGLIFSMLNRTNEELKTFVNSSKNLWDTLDDLVRTTLTNVYNDREFSSLLLRDADAFRSIRGHKSQEMMMILQQGTKIIEEIFRKYEKESILDKDISAKEAAQVLSMLMAGIGHKIIMGTGSSLKNDIAFVSKILRKVLKKN